MSLSRRYLFSALALLLVGPPATYADSYQLTLTGGSILGSPVWGTLNLNASPMSGGAFLVTGVTGVENGLSVGRLIPPNSTSRYSFPNYDDKFFPNSHPVLDNAGLLFTLVGPNGLVVNEHLYSTGTSLYVESAYLNNGLPYPLDFSFEKISVVATPEPGKGTYLFFGVLALSLVTFAKKFVARL